MPGSQSRPEETLLASMMSFGITSDDSRAGFTSVNTISGRSHVLLVEVCACSVAPGRQLRPSCFERYAMCGVSGAGLFALVPNWDQSYTESPKGDYWQDNPIFPESGHRELCNSHSYQCHRVVAADLGPHQCLLVEAGHHSWPTSDLRKFRDWAPILQVGDSRDQVRRIAPERGLAALAMSSGSGSEAYRASKKSYSCRCHGAVTAKLGSKQCLAMETIATTVIAMYSHVRELRDGALLSIGGRVDEQHNCT